MNYSSKYFWFW